jgi:hypothetical protein
MCTPCYFKHYNSSVRRCVDNTKKVSKPQ